MATLSVVVGTDGGSEKLPPTKKMKKSIRAEEIKCIVIAAIPLVGFFIFGFIPLILAAVMAFLEVPDFSVIGSTWVGTQNFVDVWKDPLFWEAVVNTLILGSSTLISQVLSLGVAYLLNQPIRGKKTFRMIYFIPYVCSVVAVTLMWRYMFNTNYGIINHLLGSTGDSAIKWLEDSKYFSFSVIVISVWSGMGYGIIMYTAALTGVNRSLVEAAKIDGANPFRVFWSVIIPTISPTSFFLLVTGVIGALQSFAMTNMLSDTGGPNGDGVTIVFYLYRRVFEYAGTMGLASASAWILAVMVLIVTVIQFVGSKKWVHYD